MDNMSHGQQFYKSHTSKHKMTTVKQYSLLKRKMANLLQNRQYCYKNNNTNGILRYKQDNKYWTDLTEELNSLGPPYRTIQQWKKVWCDFKRGQRKRSVSKGPPKVEHHMKKEPNYDTDATEREVHIKSEPKEYDENSPSTYTTYTNNFNNDYSYPDDESLQESCLDEKEMVLPDESSCSSYSYFNKPALGESVDEQSSNKCFASPPPLQPSHYPTRDQTLYTMQNQVIHQSKMVEHLLQMSSTIAGLMERQADAVEKQTEVLHRQASATERHTSVMNTFIDMIRDKMFKGSSQKTTISNDVSENSTDDIL